MLPSTSTSSSEDRALGADTPPASSFHDARAYDPAEPPRFGEWVRVEGWVDEEDRPTRREEKRIPRARPILWLALLLGLAVAGFALWRLQSPPDPATAASPARALPPKRSPATPEATAKTSAVKISRDDKPASARASATVAPTVEVKPQISLPNTNASRGKVLKPKGADSLPAPGTSKP